jgi:hypothetical protein
LAVRRFAAADAALRPAAAAAESDHGRVVGLQRAVWPGPAVRRSAAPDEPLRAVVRDAPSREAAQDAPSQEAAQDAPSREAAQDAPWQEAVPRVGPRPQAVRAFLAPGQTSPRSPQPSKRQEEML